MTERDSTKLIGTEVVTLSSRLPTYLCVRGVGGGDAEVKAHDLPGAAFVDDDVLRTQVAVDHFNSAVQKGQALRDLHRENKSGARQTKMIKRSKRTDWNSLSVHVSPSKGKKSSGIPGIWSYLIYYKLQRNSPFSPKLFFSHYIHPYLKQAILGLYVVELVLFDVVGHGAGQVLPLAQHVRQASKHRLCAECQAVSVGPRQQKNISMKRF